MKNEKTTVISIGNQKGGVGKTTTVLNLAAALGQLGKDVLVVDLDQNCGATRGLGIPEETYASSFELMVGLDDRRLDPLDLVIVTDPDEDVELPDRVSLIPANRKLEDLDAELRSKREHRFAAPGAVLTAPLQALVDARKWDYILLDTAPHLTTSTLGAYRVAEWFIIVTLPEPLSVLGMNDAVEDLRTARRDFNPDLKLLGVVIGTYAKGQKTSMMYDEELRSGFADSGQFGPFGQNISRTTAIPTAQSFGRTIVQHSPAHKSVEEYRQLAREVIERIELGRPTPAAAVAVDEPEPTEHATTDREES